MRLTLRAEAKGGEAPEFVVSYKGEELRFSATAFFTRRTINEIEFDVFEQINQYWNDLDSRDLDIIFDVYKECYEILYSASQGNLVEDIGAHVARLLSEDGPNTLKKVESWVIFRSDIIIPGDMDTEYKDDIDNNTTRDKTFIRSDYIKLISMSILLRAVMPIWGEFIFITRREVGNDFKEAHAFRLLASTPLYTSEPMVKLTTYIESIVGEDKYNPDYIMKGINSEDFCTWFLALISLRRLTIGDIRGINQNTNLIGIIYGYIRNRLNSPGGSFKDRFRKKDIEDRGPEGENKISSIERYRIKANISIGERAKLVFSVSDTTKVVEKITSLVDPELLARSIESAQVLKDHPITAPQLNLARWILKPTLSSRGLQYIPKETLVNLMGAVEAILWTQGYKYLAVLVTSYNYSQDDAMQLTGADSRTRVPDELITELEKYYPYRRESQNRRGGVDVANPVLESIDEMIYEFSTFNWRSTADRSMTREVFGSSNVRVPIKPDIRTDLVKLVIDIGSRSWI